MTAARDSEEAEAVTALERERYEAMGHGDVERLRELFHPDLVYMHSSGSSDGAEEYLARLADGDLAYHWTEATVERTWAAGDTCLLWGTMRAEATVSGATKQLSSTSLSVWTRTDDEWRLIAYHPTKVLPA